MIWMALLAGAANVASGMVPDHAREFMAVFASDPSQTMAWFAKDAVIVTGDIGGSVDETLPVIESAGAWMKTCVVSRIDQKPSPSKQELQDGPPWLKGGKLTAFAGEYACERSGGIKTAIKFDVVFKDEKVAMLALAGAEHG